MSFAVYDSRSNDNWNKSTHKANKRKTLSLGLHELNESHDLRSTTLAARKMNRIANKRKRIRRELLNGSSSPNRFLIDGEPPIQPHPSMAEKKEEMSHGPGRHRSVLVMGLIDEIYPPTICPICLYTADSRLEADSHFKKEHYSSKPFRCLHSECEQTYSSKAGLRYHLEHAHRVTLVSDMESPKKPENHNNTSSNLASPSSPTSSSSSVSSYDHNHNDINRKYKRQELLSPELQKKLEEVYCITVCPVCEEKFKRKTHVIRHLVEAHPGAEPYKCIVAHCKRTKTYATREGLVYHLTSYHYQ
ncbi:hypothetical protein EDC94DRAFT_35908 [Helicostylum pulchrum]|nr:hypothetical protein EDC94DRAFT_35908 [Helicostylum pulchrum]